MPTPQHSQIAMFQKERPPLPGPTQSDPTDFCKHYKPHPPHRLRAPTLNASSHQASTPHSPTQTQNLLQDYLSFPHLTTVRLTHKWELPTFPPPRGASAQSILPPSNPKLKTSRVCALRHVLRSLGEGGSSSAKRVRSVVGRQPCVAQQGLPRLSVAGPLSHILTFSPSYISLFILSPFSIPSYASVTFSQL